MKTTILMSILTFSITFMSTAQQSGWTDISGNVPDFPGDTIILNGGQDTLIAGFRSICFIDDDEGWISTQVYDSGVILHTLDGGISWVIQALQFPELIIAIDMKDSQHGYAASAEGSIFHTNDGGDSWDFHGPTFALALDDMDFPPGSDTGYACGMNGAIFRITSTGVESMNSGIISDMKSIFFLSPDHGWVCGEAILKEYVNGSWTGGHSYASGNWNDVFFVDEMNGWGAGRWLNFPIDTVGVLHTSNNSAWNTQPLSLDDQGDMSQVFFLDTQHGWAIQFCGKIFVTIDGGNSWSEQSPGINDETLTNIQMTSLTNGYICGNNRTLLKYTNISGINEEKESLKVDLFPNPARDKFSLKSVINNQQLSSLIIYDLNGIKLFEKQFRAENETIEVDLSQLRDGLYFVQLQLENQLITKKIIKE